VTTSPINGDELLARVKPVLKEQRVQICLRPDLMQQHENLEEELRTGAAMGGNRLNPSGKTGPRTTAEAIQALEEEIEAASVWFTFRALPKDEFRAMTTAYPPRPEVPLDLYWGYNQAEMAEALVRKCLIDPVFSEEGWASFVATCAPGEWAELRDAVMEANGGSFTPPKSLLASQVLNRKSSD
jgi:hypothetical protein